MIIYAYQLYRQLISLSQKQSYHKLGFAMNDKKLIEKLEQENKRLQAELKQCKTTLCYMTRLENQVRLLHRQHSNQIVVQEKKTPPTKKEILYRGVCNIFVRICTWIYQHVIWGLTGPSDVVRHPYIINTYRLFLFFTLLGLICFIIVFIYNNVHSEITNGILTILSYTYKTFIWVSTTTMQASKTGYKDMGWIVGEKTIKTMNTSIPVQYIRNMTNFGKQIYEAAVHMTNTSRITDFKEKYLDINSGDPESLSEMLTKDAGDMVGSTFKQIGQGVGKGIADNTIGSVTGWFKQFGITPPQAQIGQ